MSKRAAEWLLAAVIFARSTSLLFAKVGLESMSPLNLLAVRFGLAFMVLCAINPLSTAVLSAIFLKERMGVQGIIGAALILLGIVLHNYHKSGKASETAAESGEPSRAA